MPCLRGQPSNFHDYCRNPEWGQPAEFVDADSGDPLSDHDPVAVALTWDRR